VYTNKGIWETKNTQETMQDIYSKFCDHINELFADVGINESDSVELKAYKTSIKNRLNTFHKKWEVKTVDQNFENGICKIFESLLYDLRLQIPKNRKRSTTNTNT
jgi:hypothetical protein